MLINTIADLKAQLGGIQKTMAWATWEPFVRQAEIKHIIPAIGPELYEELTTALIANNNPAGPRGQLLGRLRPAVAYFAYLAALPYLATAVGDAGMALNTPANTAATPKWLYVATAKDLLEKSDFWLEASLQFLETHADDFSTWTSSAAVLIQRGRLIRSATELTAYYPAARQSRRLFLLVRDALLTAEETVVRPLLGDAFYTDLIDRLTPGGLMPFTPAETAVLRYARTAVANGAMAEMLPYLNLNADFRLVSETDGILNEDELETGRLNALVNECRDKAAGALADLVVYLNQKASATVFPLYFSSDRYVAPAAGGTTRGYQNDPDQPFFVL